MDHNYDFFLSAFFLYLKILDLIELLLQCMPVYVSNKINRFRANKACIFHICLCVCYDMNSHMKM